jgi:hypothetical protein
LTARARSFLTSMQRGEATGHGRIVQGIDAKLVLGRDWRMEVTDEFQNTRLLLTQGLQIPASLP